MYISIKIFEITDCVGEHIYALHLSPPVGLCCWYNGTPGEHLIDEINFTENF